MLAITASQPSSMRTPVLRAVISASAVLTCAANTETQLIALKISHAAGVA